MKNLPILAALVGGLCLTMTAGAQTAGQDMKAAGTETKNATKDAGKGIARGTKTAARKTKNATKKGVHKVASGTEKGAAKVKDKTTQP